MAYLKKTQKKALSWMMTFLKSLKVVIMTPSVMPSIILSTTKVQRITKTLPMVEITQQEVEVIIQRVVTTPAMATTAQEVVTTQAVVTIIQEITELTKIAPAQIIMTQSAINVMKMTATMNVPVKSMNAAMNVKNMIVSVVIVMCMIAITNVRSKSAIINAKNMSAVTVSVNHVKSMNVMTGRTVTVVNVIHVKTAKKQIALTRKGVEILTVLIVTMYTGAIILIARIAMTATT
jgi:hypothetical protein